ncbi:hypothetical protein ROS62_18940 [Streptomyces sp. DSM 41972]|uniref:Uncharacterized protein n=1 Tax=Streptomyces althioticus subsp. attaecolombicae TaxID=3075534 RepID=A0ABU3I1R0_9ACTN|nr:hypothetical protein [Streptomyces sp. DSM 41972]
MAAETRQQLLQEPGGRRPPVRDEILLDALTGDDPPLQALTLPRWPEEPDRASLERLGELGYRDGLFDEAPDLDALLP